MPEFEEQDFSEEELDPEEEEELFLLEEQDEDEYYPCIDKHIYLGSYEYFPDIGELLLMSQISLKLFYASNYNSLRNYIYWYSGVRISDPRLQIIKVYMQDGCCTAVLKTHWIRLIQRTWRKIYKQRQEYIENQKRNILQHLRSRELGRMPTEKYPGLRGML